MAFNLAEEKLGISSLLDVEDVVRPRIPDRFSILTYLSQFYHKFASSGSDSGISSVGQSPVSSDGETETRVRRKMSFGEQRGAIHSLMDGRRARSVSSQGRGVRRNSPSYLQHENPFKGKSNHTEKEYATFRKKDHTHQNPIQQTQNVNAIEKCTKELVCTVLSKPAGEPVSVLLHMKTNKLLSLTPYPKPYQSIEHPHTTSLLSQTQSYLQNRKYQRSHSQPTNRRNTAECTNQRGEYRKTGQS